MRNIDRQRRFSDTALMVEKRELLHFRPASEGMPVMVTDWFFNVLSPDATPPD
jgi:hypothetical protein